MEKVNITIESRVDSYKGQNRRVELVIKFTNHEDQDFYYKTYNLFDLHRGGFAIGRVQPKETQDTVWDGCFPASRGIGEHDYTHIPANGVHERKQNIAGACTNLEYTEDLEDECWVRYDPYGAGALGFELYDEPHGQVVGGISFPSIELPFHLYD